MNSVKVMLELSRNGLIDIKASTPDAAIILLVIEKSKLKLLHNLELKEKSEILLPTNGGL